PLEQNQPPFEPLQPENLITEFQRRRAAFELLRFAAQPGRALRQFDQSRVGGNGFYPSARFISQRPGSDREPVLTNHHVRGQRLISLVLIEVFRQWREQFAFNRAFERARAVTRVITFPRQIPRYIAPSRRISFSSSRSAIRWTVSAASGAKGTTRSMRLNNSGRTKPRTSFKKCCAARFPPPLSAAVPVEKPLTPRWNDSAPRLEVIITTALQKSATRPAASVSRPSPNTCRSRSKNCGCAFSNSSSSTTAKGCSRTFAVSRPSLPVTPPIRRCTASGSAYSLISKRTMRLRS